MRLSFTKNWNIIFPIFFLINGKFTPIKVFSWKSGSQLNLVTYPEHNALLSSRLAILLSLTTPNKQSFNVKPEVVRPVIQIIYNEKVYCTSVSKKYQILSNFLKVVSLFFFFLGIKLLFGVSVVVILSSDNPLYFHTKLLTRKSVNILKDLESG